MGKLVVVQGDAVQGTDTHTVTGPLPPPGGVYAGTAQYQYVGSITDQLSAFVKVGGKPVALVTSMSSLKPGADGGHVAALGKKFAPSAPIPTPANVVLLPAIVGVGVPNSGAGSAVLTVGGIKVLLDSDKIDTCDGFGSANSTVTAAGQSFVSCSG